MSDKQIIDDPPIDDSMQSSEDWVMPEPVFRSSEGRTPKTPENPFYADDIPTEIANKDDLAFAKAQFDAVAAGTETDAVETEADTAETEADTVETETDAAGTEADTVETEADTLETETDEGESKEDAVPEKTPQAKPKAKGGCAKSFLFMVSMIGLAAAAIIIVVIYFLYYYTPTETGTF